MDHRSKCKMQNYKFLKERIENLGGNDFLDTS